LTHTLNEIEQIGSRTAADLEERFSRRHAHTLQHDLLARLNAGRLLRFVHEPDKKIRIACAGPVGRLVGLDASEVIIAEGRRRASALGLPIVFEVADVQALPFDDDSFDACRAARLLEHVPNAELALTEMVRPTWDVDDQLHGFRHRRQQELVALAGPILGTTSGIDSTRASELQALS
jgi:hypothetical protein